MKVLFDHQIFVMQKFGGINRYFNELMQMGNDNLLVNKIDPDLFRYYPPNQKNDLFSRGVRYLKRKAGIENFKLPEEVKNTVSQNGYDIFHPTYYDPYFLELIHKPFVLTVYDMIHEIYKEYFSLSDKTSHNKRLLCEKACQIIAISSQTKEDLVQIFKIPEEKVHVIHLASDFDKVIPYQPAQTELLTNYILFTGNRGAYKNFYFTVTALADILRADQSLQLLCTGHPFSEFEIRFFKDLSVSHQVHQIYLKNDQELAWAYQNARVFIFPSLYEGFGFPLLEAFASKCPVVSSTGGSLPEVGGKAALFFNPKAFDQIQKAVVETLYNDEVRSSLIAEGTKQFTKFNWQNCRNETIKVYNSC